MSPVLGGVIAAIACILGHNYTIWLGFKGGKGIATSGGVVLALFPIAVVCCVALVWIRRVLRQQVRVTRFDCCGDRSTLRGVSDCRKNRSGILDLFGFSVLIAPWLSGVTRQISCA